MEFILVIVAAMLAGLIGWLLKQSFNTEPWIAGAVDEDAHRAPLGANAKVVALTTLLAVITSFFALIVSAYALRMELGDWIPLSEPQLLWGNTGMLVLASLAFQWTRNAAVQDETAKLKPGLLVTGVLTSLFLLGQFAAWLQLSSAGQGVTANPSNGFFYFLTVAHAIHILGGLYVWARALVRVHGGAPAVAVRESIELCTVYWHFLLLVWLFLFGLLLNT